MNDLGPDVVPPAASGGLDHDMQAPAPEGIRLYSFDLFDTLVGRPLKRPYHVFDLVERSGVVSYRLPGMRLLGFRRWRILAERIARRFSDREDITVWDIYRVLAWWIRNPAQVARRELRLEQALLAPIPENVAVLLQRLDAGHSCCVITDMYLPVAFLKRIVRGIVGRDLPLFASSDLGLTKRSGALYRYVAQHYGLKFAEIEHCGDNAVSDGRVPEDLGIRTRRVPGRCMRDTSVSLLEYFAPRGLEDSTLAMLGYSLVGPVSVAFARYLKAETERQGLRKVFFCARDTYLIKEAFERMGGATESRYLRLSRRALYVPMFARQKDPERLFEGRVSAREFFERLDLQPPQELLGMRPSEHAGVFMKALERLNFGQCAQEEADILLEYLAREGFQGDVALVDLGWRGTLQESLEALVGDRCRIHGYYFGHIVPRNNRAGYYFDDCLPLQRLARVFQSLPVFEFLFTEPIHSVKRIRRSGGGFAFDYVDDEPRSQVLARHEIARGCRQFLDDFARVAPFLPAEGDWAARSLDRLIDRILARPDAVVITAFEGMGHAEGFGGSKYGDILRRDSFTLAGYRNSFWRSAYVRATPGPQGWLARVVHAMVYSRVGMYLIFKQRRLGVRLARLFD
ncbi:hypothetical protein [Thioalkalivibrio paradoxus]|uniref:Hydrolase n=1 Tax=Thioalkalivibrio paradoxus ARh 1 TaxID=713585 RepID=W0DNQ8_9GAMM|nr:hypothetical protein [Thioalkalivibrio paradoxus]AHF00205.1 hypothetical protein THITH_12490 [Thioalkalivibrio paradoxus ARh 1]